MRPLIALVAWVSRHAFGESLPAIRFLPALAGAGMVFMTGLLARELGGRSGAVFLACLGVLCAPVYLIGGTLLSMNAFEPLFWTGCLWLVWRAVERGDSRLWIWAGLLAGLGLENKHSTAFFLTALAAGLLLSGRWRVIRDPWMWAGLGLALLLFLPNLVWQYLHDWATLELLQNVKRIHKNVELTPWAFVGQQMFILLPTTALVWVAGLWRCLRRGAGSLRLLGWTYLALLAIMIVLKAKHYYLAPIYPALFAAGGLWWEDLTPKRWPRWAVAGSIAATGALFLPMSCRCFLRTGSSRSRKRWESLRRKPRWPTKAPCPSTSATCSAGRRWWRRSPGSGVPCRRSTAPAPRSWQATTARPARWTSSGPATGCPRRSAPTRATTSGARATPPARS